jgi:acid phosphatase family membrane protein YuiD
VYTWPHSTDWTTPISYLPNSQPPHVPYLSADSRQTASFLHRYAPMLFGLGQPLNFFLRRPFVAAFIAFAIAQITKCFTYYYTENKWDFTRIVGSGGMTSSHTSMVRAALIRGTSRQYQLKNYWISLKLEARLGKCHMLPCNRDCRLFTANRPLSPAAAGRIVQGLTAATQVLGLTTALGCISGTSAPAFAVALIFSMVRVVQQQQKQDRAEDAPLDIWKI